MSGMKGGSSPLPKFGEWDVNDPSGSEGYTMIFNKARDERKQNSMGGPESSTNRDEPGNRENPAIDKHTKKWCCCFQASPTQD